MNKFEDSSLLHCLTVAKSTLVLLSIYMSLYLLRELYSQKDIVVARPVGLKFECKPCDIQNFAASS